AGAFGEVGGIVAVDPREDDVDVEVDVIGVVVEHPRERGPADAVPLDRGRDGVVARDASAGERVRAGGDDLGLAERPELQLDGRVDDAPSGPGLGGATGEEQE